MGGREGRGGFAGRALDKSHCTHSHTNTHEAPTGAQAGCVGLFAQLAGFTYLIWWELSWDVMEPVAYMLSLTYRFVAQHNSPCM